MVKINLKVKVDKYFKIEEPIFCLNLDDVLCLLGVVIARLVLEEPVAWVECCALALCKLVEPWSFALQLGQGPLTLKL
jgi:hypothetical protein